MDIVTIILNAAKTAKVSGTLLLAICSHESNNFKFRYVHHDHGSPSYGICMVKYETAKMLGFKGKAQDLMTDKLNAKMAAKYLKFQENRYYLTDNLTDWCKVTSAYNAGTYTESKKIPGKPRNLKYVRLVQKRLPEDFKYRLNCENRQIAENTEDR